VTITSVVDAFTRVEVVIPDETGLAIEPPSAQRQS
jgi:hypothetical protein